MILKRLLCISFMILNLTGFSQSTLISGMDNLIWEEVMSGIWKTSIGKTSGLNPLNYTNSPKNEPIANLAEAPFPFNKDISYSQITQDRAIVRLPLSASEKIYGLGLDFNGMNRRADVYNLKVDHYGGIKGHTHAPVPFYVSSKGYGVLINSAKRVKIYVGSGNRKDSNKPEPLDRTTNVNWSSRPKSDAIEASIQGDGMEVYVFCGNSPLEAVQRYNLFCGGGVLPPKWGLGLWHRMHTRSTTQDVLKEIEDFKRYNFPIDVIGLEPGWQSFAYPCSYDWDTTRFPNPAKFVQTLKEKNIRINLWENPYVASTSTMYNSIEPYTGSHTVWLGEVPDYTIPAAREVLLKHHEKNHTNLGVSGYKIDEVDGYDVWLWPDHATFPSGNDAVEIRQLYGQILQNTLTNYYKQKNQRTYGLIRSSYIGASSQSFVLYSDHYEHKGYITALVNSSLSGLLWTPEIRSAKNPEEWVRRFQSVCFSPLMMLNAWSSGKKPWSFPEVTDIVRENITLRMKLLPYLYTAFYEYNKKGIPPFRAMVLENDYDEKSKVTSGKLDDTDNPYAEKKIIEVTDQYMMGSYMLVAPVLEKQTERSVILPKGNWYDFYTGKYVGNGEKVIIQTKLEHIPLFVKDGAIIPMLADLDKDNSPSSLQVRHYGTKENNYLLYNDDGETYNFEKGDYTLLELKVVKNKSGKLVGKSSFINNKKYPYGKVDWLWMSN